MGYATIIVIVFNLIAVAFATYSLYRVRDRMEEWVVQAIGDEIRKQDDRIQKRLLRSNGTPLDSPGQEEDNNRQRIGQPYRR